MSSETTRFSGDGGRELEARVHLPVGGRPRAWALLADCFSAAGDPGAGTGLVREMNRAGMAVVRLDLTAGVRMDGEKPDVRLAFAVGDVEAAGRHMSEAWGAPGLLIGHSLGGPAVIHAGRALGSVGAVATIGAPAGASCFDGSEGNGPEVDRPLDIHLGGLQVELRGAFLRALEGPPMADAFDSLDRPLLILHSPVDDVVSQACAGRLYRAAHGSRSYVSLDGADHFLTEPAAAGYAGGVIAVWASRHLDLTPIPPPEAIGASGSDPYAGDATSSPPIPGERAVVRIGREHYRTEVWADGHHLVSDEPEAKGGGGAGPGPYEFVVAGLGSCTAITLRMYADRKEWPLEEVHVILRHTRQHAPDGRAPDGEGGEPKLDRIERELVLVGDLDADQRARLAEIADRCPVHRTLTAGVDVVTKLRSGSGGGGGGTERGLAEKV